MYSKNNLYWEKGILSLLLIFSINTTIYSQDIYPSPQHIKIIGKRIKTPKNVKVIFDNAKNENFQNKIEKLLPEISSTHKSTYSIYIGKKGDKSIKQFSKNIPDKKEGYYLAIDSKKIVIAGADTRGMNYGLQTLTQLLSNDSIPTLEIIDFPDIPIRGVVEGFYGTPWSFDSRISQIKFYGENKLNTYIYGPKDDPYHSSPNWRLPYPSAEAEAIKTLVECANDNNVDFVWAIHPGQDIKWTQEDKDALISKFRFMHDLGVRSFAVFFDDISGEGTKADKQAELLNYINDKFIQPNNDIEPLVMCPTEYNKSWANVEKGYLPTLGKELDKNINIMWTGDRVCTDILESSVDWINELIERPAYIWWNFPVSDYVRDHLLMGRVYGNDTTIAKKVSGFVTNPMEHAEASKIAIHGVADYTWNMDNYDDDKAWIKAITLLMPNDNDALLKFVQHNSDLGPNGHLFRRVESENISSVVNSINTDLNSGKKINTEDLTAIKQEFTNIIDASNVLLASSDNKELTEEIKPWILQFKNLGETGNVILDMYSALQNNNQKEFIKKYKVVQALHKINYEIDTEYNQNPYQPGVKTASLHLTPLVNNMFSLLVDKYNTEYKGTLEAKSSYSPFTIETNISQLKNILLQTKLNNVIIPPLNEVIKWDTMKYLIIESTGGLTFSSFKINIESNDDSSSWKLELSQDGNNWTPYNGNFEFNKKSNISNIGIKYIKLINTGADKEIKLKRNEIEFTR